VVPLFLFWLWLTWLIVLFGLELTYALHTMQQGRFAHARQEDADDLLLDRTLLLPVITRVALAFRRARLCYVHELGRELLLPEAGVRRLLAQLEQAGFVHRVEDRREVGYTLAMPAADIDAAQVLSRAGALAAPAFVRHATPFASLVERLDRGVQRELGTTTVADLCQQVEAAAPSKP
jgi:membrane protein